MYNSVGVDVPPPDPECDPVDVEDGFLLSLSNAFANSAIPPTTPATPATPVKPVDQTPVVTEDVSAGSGERVSAAATEETEQNKHMT